MKCVVCRSWGNSRGMTVDESFPYCTALKFCHTDTSDPISIYRRPRCVVSCKESFQILESRSFRYDNHHVVTHLLCVGRVLDVLNALEIDRCADRTPRKRIKQRRDIGDAWRRMAHLRVRVAFPIGKGSQTGP
jgi:hypothetical protein